MTKIVSTSHVTKNLHDAACNLRGNAGKAYTVWVHGVCINQDDVDERNGQMCFMRRIMNLLPAHLSGLETLPMIVHWQFDCSEA